MNKTGIIAGAFDIIHPGYVLAFMEAKMHCDTLIVCLHVDPSVDNPEKPQPVLSVPERTVILSAIRQVDGILPYHNEAEFLAILKEFNPDIRFLGQDYSAGIKAITGSELNIPLHFLDRTHGWSETRLKELLVKSMEKA